MERTARGSIGTETTSLCPTCLARVAARTFVRRGTVRLARECPRHGRIETLLEEDAGWYSRRLEYDRPGTDTRRETGVELGCPFDCGLCPDHEQHTCIALLEVTNGCDLGCPVCYADAGAGEPRPLERLERMMDGYVEAEGGAAEILQVSGGEPTTHPEILEVLAAARARPIRYVMLNTNGVRIATDDAFVDALADLTGGFEVYLQFDGFDPGASRRLRGADLVETKLRAVRRLGERGIPVTLVATVAAGVNDHEVGRIAGFGLETPGVRGVNFQPLAAFGRGAPDPGPRRVTLSGVLRRLQRQTRGLLRMDDFVPLPCNVERVAITFLYRKGRGFVPITRRADFRRQLPFIANTLAFDMRDALDGAVKGLMDGAPLCDCLSFVRRVLPIAPPKLVFRSEAARARFVTENTFRITVTSFLDRFDFEERAMRKECVHILAPDGRRVPFSAFNILHRRAAAPAAAGGEEAVIERRPVEVSRAGFLFCRVSLAVLLWAGYAFRIDSLVVAAAAILALSAVVGVRRAPLVLLGRLLAVPFRARRTEYLDERGMRFAHAVGALFAAITAVLLFLAPGAGRVALLLLCLLKTSAALGACSALKLYDCATSGGCCGLGRSASRSSSR